MKKKFKSVISMIMVSVMLLGVAAAGIGAASAADSTEYTEGAYSYTVTDGKAKITNVIGIAGDVALPATLGGYPVTCIGELSVRSEGNLVNVLVPSCVEAIETSAFVGCTMLETVTFEDNSKLKSLGNTAFMNCSALETVDFGENSVLESIGESAFVGCSSLERAVLPAGLKTIGPTAFERCASLGDVAIPSSVETVGIAAFASCESLEKFVVDAENPNFASDEWGNLCNKEKTKIVSYPAGSKRAVYAVPAYVQEIERSAFSGAKYLEDLTWLNCDMKIGLSAFADCANLYRVTIPEGTTYLSDWMFNACFSLTEVNLPESLETIGSGVFHWCTNLEHIELPSGLKLLYNNAFNDCFGLKSVTLPDGLEQIAPTAFQKCYSLESIDFPASVNYIGGTAFYQNYSLKEITFPEGIKDINEDIMRYCFALEKVNLPESTEKIYAGAFEDCRNLKTLSIPKNVNSVTGEAFVNCVAFEGVSVDNGNAYFSADSNGILFSNDETRLVYYPANKAQTVYTVPGTVSVIGAYAFTDVQNMAAVVVPDSVTEIEANAFNSSNIRDIYFEGTAEEWNAFSVGSVTAQLHFNYNGSDHIHDYSQEFTIVPTCAGNGKKSFVCDCGENTEIDYHYAASRMLCFGASYESKVLSESDCESKGQISIRCTVCEKEFGNYESDKKEHELDITISDSEGKIEYNCTECEYSYSEIIPEGAKYIRYNSEAKDRVHIYNVGDKIAVLPEPEKDGLEFFGWKDENGEVVELSTMPDMNLELTAAFGSIVKADAADVTLIYDEDCFDEPVTLSVVDITGEVAAGGVGSGDITFHELLEDSTYASGVGFYNIKMVNSNKEVEQPQPGKTVKVRMKIPDNYSENSKFMVMHWKTDESVKAPERFSTFGKYNEMTRNGDYLEFYIDSFSEFGVYVVDEVKAEIIKTPDTSYYYKSSLDLSGIELKVNYPDGSTETVTDTSKMKVSGFDSSKIGEQTVTVEYEGAKAEFEVSISYAWWQWIIRILLLGFLWY